MEPKINCEICGKQLTTTKLRSVQLCRRHFTEKKESEYLDNSRIRDLGIVKFAEEILPQFTPQKTPYFHKIFYYMALKLYLPVFRNKLERLLLLLSFRGSSKSTAMNCILILYLMIFNGRKYSLKVRNKKYECLIREAFIVIVSETGPMAEDFVVRVRDELQINEMINYLWPGKIQAAYDAVDKAWTKRAFKYNDCFLLGVGQGMQIRGRIKGASRVSFLIGDDIYSENNTITPTGTLNTFQKIFILFLPFFQGREIPFCKSSH